MQLLCLVFYIYRHIPMFVYVVDNSCMSSPPPWNVATHTRYREKLEHLVAAMYQPHAKLQELLILQSQQCRPNDVYSDTIAEEDVEAMCRLLKQQRDGLQHLTDILTKDGRDIALVKRELSAVHHTTY